MIDDDDVETDTPVRYIIRQPEVQARTGLSPALIRELERKGDFPARIRLSKRAVGWLDHQIEAWLDDRIELSQEYAGAVAAILRGGTLH